MDLSVYITELLNEHGTISIPKIGVFKQVRMRGYYNADEGKLYPPYFQTEFVQQPVEDDSLLQYLTSKSKVSASSAKYFMDKYLQNILQQAEIGEVMLGKLGWLSKEDENLNFRPATAGGTGTAVFGFEPVSILPAPAEETPVKTAEPVAPQINETPVSAAPSAPAPEPVTAPAPVKAEPFTPPVYSVERDNTVIKKTFQEGPVTASSPLLRQHTKPVEKPESRQPVPVPPATPAPAAQTAQIPVNNEAKGVELDEKPFYAKPWFFGVIAAVVAAGILLYFIPFNTVKKEQPATTASATSSAPSTDSVSVKTPPTTAPVIKDTAAKPQAKPESVITAGNKPMPASTEFAPEVETPVAKPAALVNTNNYKFVLMSGAFGNEAAAMQVVNRYKAIGVPAGILKNVSRSKYVKVTLGFFKTYAEGQAAKARLVKLKKLRSRDLYVETLKN